MSFYRNNSGVTVHRNRFPGLSYRQLFDCGFGELIPIMRKFVLPGDVWKIGANLLIRYQPMITPPLTRAFARVRYFYVPLRLVERDTELIITGSKDGKLYEETLPKFESFLDYASGDALTVKKYSFWDYMNVPCIDYTNIKFNECMPALYYLKAYSRIWFDYYRDENFDENDFTEFWYNCAVQGGNFMPLTVRLKKDYFTSSLPWQLKGTAPTIEIIGNGSTSLNFKPFSGNFFQKTTGNNNVPNYDGKFGFSNDDFNTSANNQFNSQINNYFQNDPVDAISISSGFIDMSQWRTMAQQTRVFERLARCGSRYTEYLYSNFGTAPADETLQRAQYLGGFKQPIVTTEVVQTAEGTNPVGTLRGHGISNGGNTIKPFVAKEFGVIFGLLDIMPEIQYTQGIDRDLTYKSRFDFFNPSFQSLSEQEVRNGELFVANDGKNDETFGFQPIYTELKYSQDHVCADLRDTMSFWTQAINFKNRPNLSKEFLDSKSYLANFNQPFAVTTGKPIIVDVYNYLDAYRPIIRDAVPGFGDHN